MAHGERPKSPLSFSDHLFKFPSTLWLCNKAQEVGLPVNNAPEVWEARGPLLALILQALEDASPAASPLVQLFVDLLKHLLHLPGRRFVELLRDVKNSGRAAVSSSYYLLRRSL